MRWPREWWMTVEKPHRQYTIFEPQSVYCDDKHVPIILPSYHGAPLVAA
jgi:hypothetical protein